MLTSVLPSLAESLKKLKLVDDNEHGCDEDRVMPAPDPTVALENGEPALQQNGQLLDSLLQEDKFSR